jgi:hypothetical protein
VRVQICSPLTPFSLKLLFTSPFAAVGLFSFSVTAFVGEEAD